MAEKISISLDDVNSPAVDDKLRRLAQEEENFTQPEPPQTETSGATGLWYNTIFYMSVFGLLGGLLGWGLGELMYLRPDQREPAKPLMAAYDEVLGSWQDGQIDDKKAEVMLDDMRRRGRGNEYFRVYSATHLKREQKQERLDSMSATDAWKDRIAHVLAYAAAGLCIAMCLAAAEPLVERNWQRAVLNGSVAALIGLAGGVGVSMFIERIPEWIVVGQSELYTRIAARAIGWGVLGLCVGIAPGLLMGNVKRTLIGAAGGLVGGVVGGLLFHPIQQATASDHMSRLAAVVVIGLVAGLFTGLIENAAKQGWLRVTAGLIAGKQFVLYRNPTFIGNSLQCHVYLFKDPQVGRRHAAIHLVPGGFEIEDLPLGSPTFVNGRPVARARLHNGDQIRIGSTMLMFQEKSSA